MRLIDSEKIRTVVAPIAQLGAFDDVHYERIAFADEIDNIPTVNTAPIIHAHWIREPEDTAYENVWVCSNCGEDFIQHRKPKIRYCPHCGAKMDEANE